MRGTAMTLRSPTASTEETVTSYMVLTSCPASKFISQSVPHPLSHHCVAPSVSPPSLCPSLFLSVYLWCHCCWSPCLLFLGYDRSTCTPAAHLTARLCLKASCLHFSPICSKNMQPIFTCTLMCPFTYCFCLQDEFILERGLSVKWEEKQRCWTKPRLMYKCLWIFFIYLFNTENNESRLF